jgi:hypothetical protein
VILANDISVLLIDAIFLNAGSYGMLTKLFVALRVGVLALIFVIAEFN